MKSFVTTGIILSRTDYGEADRVVTILTPDYGKLRLMARGVRKIKSRVAGGIELFSISEISFMQGRGELGTLISARLNLHYGTIIQDIQRVQLGYILIKMLHRATEEQTEADYFELLVRAFSALNDPTINLDLIDTWFQAQLLRLSGHRPNLEIDGNNIKLNESERFNFNFDNVSFVPASDGLFNVNHVKSLRILFSQNEPRNIARVQGINQLLPVIALLISTLRRSYIKS